MKKQKEEFDKKIEDIKFIWFERGKKAGREEERKKIQKSTWIGE